MKKTLVAICSVLLLVGCGSSSDSTDTTAVTATTSASSDGKVKPFEMTLTVGENTGSNVVINVVQDTQVVLTFMNPDSSDEIHLHGYDLSTGTIKQGDSAVLTFEANQTGDFEIESHETGELLATLRINAP